MTYSVNWVTRVITIPVSSMISLGDDGYELQADSFWRELRRLEWAFADGLWAPQILRHADTRTLAGATFVPENEIINGFTVLMDPLAKKVFLRGDNNNIIDVIVFNGVSVIPSNTAGNTVTFVNNSPAPSQQQIRDAMGISSTDGNAPIERQLQNLAAQTA